MVRRTRETRAGRRGRGRKGVRSVDLSDVQTFVAFPEGTFHLRVKEIEEGEGDAGDYWKWVFEDASKKPVEGTVTHITSFAKQALFNLKSLLESLEVEIPDSEFDLVIEDMIGLEMMAETAQEDVETDNGRRTYTRIVDHWPLDADDAKPKSSKKGGKEEDEEEEDEKPARRSRAGKPKAVTEEDVSEMSQDELEEMIEAHKLDIDLGDFKTVSKMRAGVIAALKDAGVIEGEEEEAEEEDDRPSRRSSRSRSSKKREPEEEEAEEEEPPRRRRARG